MSFMIVALNPSTIVLNVLLPLWLGRWPNINKKEYRTYSLD